MKLGLHLSNFTYGVPTAELAAKLTEIVVGGEALELRSRDTSPNDDSVGEALEILVTSD